MIYDSLNNAAIYSGVSDRVKKALEFLGTVKNDLPDGRIEIQGSDIYALVMTYQTRNAESAQFEAHKKYIDVQYIISGDERIDVCMLSPGMQISEPYSAESDFMLYTSPNVYSSLEMRAGCFAVLYPHDLHRPSCHLTEQTTVRKVVVKVKV